MAHRGGAKIFLDEIELFAEDLATSDLVVELRPESDQILTNFVAILSQSLNLSLLENDDSLEVIVRLGLSLAREEAKAWC